MPPDFNSPLSFSNLFSTLPPQFYTKLQPTPLPNPYLVGTSESAAQLLGLDTREFNSEDYVALFTGNTIADKSEPLAAVYSGHQFGHWAGQLGDGRAILLGDLGDKNSAQRWEVQLKGAGMTPYSRMGDGRAVLRSSIREFLCSEAMAHLGIPTSRALCVTGSDQMVWRETPETTAVVTRLAPTFIRFGSFQHWYYKGDAESLQTLADFVLQNYFPELLSADNPYQALLTEITKRTAKLMAHWQAVGFMHGVMNTDNMSILGITLDYGPYGFMEAFDANHICNHTDQQGRYAYNMQPQIGQWNCHALGQALLPLIGNVKDTETELAIYPSAYEQKWSQLLHQKFGLALNQDDDDKLFDNFFDLMQANHADFTLVFRTLGSVSKHDEKQDETLRDLFIDRPALDDWLANYRTRLQVETATDEQRRTAMNAVNPKYVLRNYLAQIAIEKAQKNDFSEVAKLLKILERPYDEQPENESYAALPPDWASKLEVSCSS
jgi:serine/tyrosine/threonine adenylyltransferase